MILKHVNIMYWFILLLYIHFSKAFLFNLSRLILNIFRFLSSLQSLLFYIQFFFHIFFFYYVISFIFFWLILIFYFWDIQNIHWQWNKSSMYNNSLRTVCPLFIHIIYSSAKTEFSHNKRTQKKKQVFTLIIIYIMWTQVVMLFLNSTSRFLQMSRYYPIFLRFLSCSFLQMVS
jgi:hypothetical protein